MQTRSALKTVLGIVLFAIAGCQSSKADANAHMSVIKTNMSTGSPSSERQSPNASPEIVVSIIDSSADSGKIRIAIGEKSIVLDLPKLGRETGFQDGKFRMTEFYSRQSRCRVVEFEPNALSDGEFLLEITFDCNSSGQAIVITDNDNNKVWRMPVSDSAWCTRLQKTTNTDQIKQLSIDNNILTLDIQDKIFKANLADHIATGHWALYHDFFYQNFSGVLIWTCYGERDGLKTCFCNPDILPSDINGFDPSCNDVRYAKFAFMANKNSEQLQLKLIVKNFHSSTFPDQDSNSAVIKLSTPQ